jgi:hypothetical protein
MPELWLYSRYGALRFFRIGAGLEEIGRDGCRSLTVSRLVLGLLLKDNTGSSAPAPIASVQAGSGTPSIRWLKKRNSMKNSGADETDATGTVNPGKIPDAGSRGPDTGQESPNRCAGHFLRQYSGSCCTRGSTIWGSLPQEPASSPTSEDEGVRAGGMKKMEAILASDAPFFRTG